MKKIKQTEDWEERFDNIKCDVEAEYHYDGECCYDNGVLKERIKDFIRSLLKEQKEEGYRKGRKEALEEQKELNYWISLARARGMNPEAFNIFWKSKQKEV